MSELCNNLVAFLQERFPSAPVLNHENIVYDLHGNEEFRIWPMIAQDPQSGVKQRAIVVHDLGSKDELQAIAQSMNKIFYEMDSSVYFKSGNNSNPTGHEIGNTQMAFSPRVILYTNKLCASIDHVIVTFNMIDTLIEVVDKSKMHKTLSYFLKFKV